MPTFKPFWYLPKVTWDLNKHKFAIYIIHLEPERERETHLRFERLGSSWCPWPCFSAVFSSRRTSVVAQSIFHNHFLLAAVDKWKNLSFVLIKMLFLLRSQRDLPDCKFWIFITVMSLEFTPASRCRALKKRRKKAGPFFRIIKDYLGNRNPLFYNYAGKSIVFNNNCRDVRRDPYGSLCLPLWDFPYYVIILSVWYYLRSFMWVIDVYQLMNLLICLWNNEACPTKFAFKSCCRFVVILFQLFTSACRKTYLNFLVMIRRDNSPKLINFGPRRFKTIPL